MAMGQKMTARRKAAVVNWLRSSHAVACAAGETESQPTPPWRAPCATNPPQSGIMWHRFKVSGIVGVGTRS